MMDSICKMIRPLGAAALLLALTPALWARSTGTTPARTAPDAWCVGKAGAEVCVDADGNVIPTTDNDTTLGTSSLRWATGYMLDLTIGDDLTITDDVVIGSTVTEIATVNGLLRLGLHQSPDASVTPTAAGQLIWNITQSPYELCMSTGATAGAWVRFSTPTSACQN